MCSSSVRPLLWLCSHVMFVYLIMDWENGRHVISWQEKLESQFWKKKNPAKNYVVRRRKWKEKKICFGFYSLQSSHLLLCPVLALCPCQLCEIVTWSPLTNGEGIPTHAEHVLADFPSLCHPSSPQLSKLLYSMRAQRSVHLMELSLSLLSRWAS